MGCHVIKSEIIYMHLNCGLMNSAQQCNRKKKHDLFILDQKWWKRFCLCTDNSKHPTPSLPLLFYMWMPKVVKSLWQLGSYNSMATLLSALFMSLPSLKIKLQVLPKPRMSASVKIYENTLWLETYLFWTELQVI